LKRVGTSCLAFGGLGIAEHGSLSFGQCENGYGDTTTRRIALSDGS
jgi:hypothetical protein